MFPCDLPRLDHPLPKALDDAAAARLLRAAQAGRRMLVRVTVEMLLRTEYFSAGHPLRRKPISAFTQLRG